MKNKKIFRLCLASMLACAALVMSYIESLIPQLPFLPPGAKAGFSNIAVIFSSCFLSPFYTGVIVLAKGIFAFLTRGASAGLMSISGGALSAIITYILIKCLLKKIGIVSISIIGAVFHNLGQLIAGAIILSSVNIFYYTPALIVFALITGSVNGAISKAVINHIKSIKEKDGTNHGF